MTSDGSNCQGFDFGHVAHDHATRWTTLDALGRSVVGGLFLGQDVPELIGQEHVVWDVFPAYGGVDMLLGLGGCSGYGHRKCLARSKWSLDGAERRDEGHGEVASAAWTPPGHYSG